MLSAPVDPHVCGQPCLLRLESYRTHTLGVVMLVFLALLLALFPATLRPAGDDDGDGASNLRETVNGCNPLSAASFPTCQWGEVVACSLTEPGFTPPPEPC